MPFDTFSPRLRDVANAALVFCKSRYGKNGLKLEVEIAANITWRPSFHLRPTSSLIVATEVSDVLYPEILKIAAHSLAKFDHPVAVYQVCPLDIYVADPKQTLIRALKADGFGVITVDDTGVTTVQHNCAPLAQHLSEDILSNDLQGLTSRLKVAFRSAHATYLANVGQGVQAVGQVVEALIGNAARGAIRDGLQQPSFRKLSAAQIIDGLYAISQFKNHRAALGGARDFLKEYRNASSHPASTARQEIAKIRRCRIAFIDSIRIAKNLCVILKDKGYSLTVHVT